MCAYMYIYIHIYKYTLKDRERARKRDREINKIHSLGRAKDARDIPAWEASGYKRVYFHARFMRGSCAEGWPTRTPHSLPLGTLKEDTKLNMIFKLLLLF